MDAAEGAGVEGRLRHHSCVMAERVPVRMVSPLGRWMETVESENVAVQPWSQRTPTEMREPEARVGKMWACRAERGRPGMASLAVCVEVMVLPLGRRTVMPGVAAVRLV